MSSPTFDWRFGQNKVPFRHLQDWFRSNLSGVSEVDVAHWLPHFRLSGGKIYIVNMGPKSPITKIFPLAMSSPNNMN